MKNKYIFTKHVLLLCMIKGCNRTLRTIHSRTQIYNLVEEQV